MICLDELQFMKVYRNKKFIIPINEKDKRHGSMVWLMTPSTEDSLKLMHHPLIINKYYESFYLEKNAVLFVNSENFIEDIVGHKYLSVCHESDGFIKNDMLRANFGPDKNFLIPLTEDARNNGMIRKILWNDRIKTVKELDTIYDDIAKKRGFYLKGGAIDYEKVYNTVINDLKSASLGKVTFDRL